MGEEVVHTGGVIKEIVGYCFKLIHHSGMSQMDEFQVDYSRIEDLPLDVRM